MPLPTLADVSPVDPVLTDLSFGFRNAAYYWDQVAPPVKVDKMTGTYFTWTKDFWFRREAGALRAPSAGYTRIGTGVSTSTYRALERGFEELVSDVIRAASQTPESLDVQAVAHLTEILQIELEKLVAAAAFVNGVWGTSSALSGTDQWSDLANSDPINDADVAKRTIRRATGAEPNFLGIGALTWEVLKEHPLILDKYKHTQTGIMTEDLVAAALGVPQLTVMKSIENTADENITFAGADIWTDSALFLVRTPTPDLMVPNGAYTFIWDEIGNFPWAMQAPYREEPTRNDVHRILTHSDTSITASDYGYLLLDTNA
jgi:hypothetical protein